MTHNLDEMRLQAYLDGELDREAMAEMDAFIEGSETARAYIADMARSTAWLKAEMNGVLEEEVPDRLLEAINGVGEEPMQQVSSFSQWKHIAAAMVLLVVGFGSGILLDREQSAVPQGMVAYAPASFSTVVEDALEHSVRGASKEWYSSSNTLSVKVTPTQTYRDKDGVYYREYHMEMKVENEHRQVDGLAYRNAQGHWKTKALFFSENDKSI